MDPILTQVLQYLGLGAGGVGVAVTGILFFYGMKLRNHDEVIKNNTKRCDAQDNQLVDHGQRLVKIETISENLESGQKGMDKKLDRLIDLHLNTNL